MERLKGLNYPGEWREQAVLCGMPEPQVFDAIQQAAISQTVPGQIKLWVKLYRDRVITVVYDNLTKNVLTQAECQFIDGCCPPVTTILTGHQTPISNN